MISFFIVALEITFTMGPKRANVKLKPTRAGAAQTVGIFLSRNLNARRVGKFSLSHFGANTQCEFRNFSKILLEKFSPLAIMFFRRQRHSSDECPALWNAERASDLPCHARDPDKCP
jgi:hypothetical protein